MRWVKLIDIETKQEIARIGLARWRKEAIRIGRSNGQIAANILGDHRLRKQLIDAIIIENKND